MSSRSLYEIIRNKLFINIILQIRRRGYNVRQRLHQQAISASVSRPCTLADTHSVLCNVPTGVASGSSRLAESTPLLGKKR